MPRDKRLFNYRAENDLVASPVACLAGDGYVRTCAHAADYGTDTAKYIIEAFVQAIKWTNAERLYRGSDESESAISSLLRTTINRVILSEAEDPSIMRSAGRAAIPPRPWLRSLPCRRRSCRSEQAV